MTRPEITKVLGPENVVSLAERREEKNVGELPKRMSEKVTKKLSVEPDRQAPQQALKVQAPTFFSEPKPTFIPQTKPTLFAFGAKPESKRPGRKKQNSNERVWSLLVFRCRHGHYPEGMTTAKDMLRMERYYDSHPRMTLARKFVAAERKGEHFDPGDIRKNVGRAQKASPKQETKNSGKARPKAVSQARKNVGIGVS